MTSRAQRRKRPRKMNASQRAIIRGLTEGQGDVGIEFGSCPTPERPGYPSRAAAYADVPLTAGVLLPGKWVAYLCTCSSWHFRGVH